MRNKRIAIIALALAAAMSFSGCSAGGRQAAVENTSAFDYGDAAEKITESARTTEENYEIKELDITVLYNQNNEAAFSFTIDEFIESFNGCYRENNGEAFLRPSSAWDQLTYDETPHSKFPGEYYRFQQDVNNYNQPTISVYVPENSGFVQEITLDFPEHSYTEWGYKMFEEICFYSFRVFFPGLDDQQIQAVYGTVFDKVYDSNIYFKSVETPGPKALYYKGNVGIYPYFRVGMLFFALIPVTEQYLDELASDNVEIYKIDDLI